MSATPPRRSASLVLLRQGEAGLEVFMLLRHAGIAHFGGALVFPGGCVDADDEREAWTSHCSSADAWGADELALRVAAIREGFEESGVLLARERASGEFVSAERMAALGVHRKAVDAGRQSFLELIMAEDLDLATDRLVQIGHWITPRVLKKRFDTVFFAARVPAALALSHDGRETVESAWGTAGRFLGDADAGRNEVLLPTRCNLLRIDGYANAAELLDEEARRPPVTVLPEPERDGDQVVLRIPEEAGYPICSERLPMPGR